MTYPPGELLTIARCFSAIEAHILQGRLEAEGIPAVLADENLIQVNDLLNVAVGGVRIRVPSARAAEATAIVEAIRRGDFALADGTEQSQP